jgi:hypothetical protein
MRVYSCPTSFKKTWIANENLDACDYVGEEDYMPLARELNISFIEVPPILPDVPASYACDLWSFKHLGLEGGWYSDMDILWVKPMIEIEANVVLCKTRNVSAIGFLAGIPNCLFWQLVFQQALQNYNPQEYQSCGVLALQRLVGPRQLRRHHVKYVPTETVYPWDHLQTDCIFDQTLEVPEATIGIHWFGGHPNSQGWNNILTKENYCSAENTFCHYARKLCL